ncbi:MAG: hypothetical protein ACI8ZN_000702 [Bacteroidia bacterium]|jgi:uncharacterized protein (DUF58 family)
MNLTEKDIVRSDNLDLMAQQVVEGFITGLHKSPYHGFSVEFAEHRQYNTGESVKNIDWKLFARTERLYVKRYEEETNLRCNFLIDSSASMYFPDDDHSKIRFSVLATASLMHLLKRQRDAVSLIEFNQTIEQFTQTKSSGTHHLQLMQILSGLLDKKPDQRKSNVVNTLHEIAERIHRRSLVVIFSDMFDSDDPEAVFDALQHLKFNKHEVILFHTLHHGKEVDFAYENRPFTFEDIETGEKLRLFPSEVKDHYQREVENFHTMLKFRCAQYKIDFVEADVSKSMDAILLPFLLKRKRMSR